MSKLKMNPDFTGEDVETNPVSEKELNDFVKEDDQPVKGDEGEQKQTLGDEPEEEGIQSDNAPADEEPGSEEDETGKTTDDDKKLQERELEGLVNEEKKLDKDLSDLDLEIQATKDRIAQKRGDRREQRELSRQPQETKEEEVDISDIDKDDVERVEKILKSKGYVRKDELERQNATTTQRGVEDVFYKSNPQYLPENDK